MNIQKDYCDQQKNFMKKVIIKDKQKYLDENYPFTEVPELADRRKCIHCDSVIIVGNYKIYSDISSKENK